MVEPQSGWNRVEVGEERPRVLAVVPGQLGALELLERPLGPGERLTLWLSGDGAATSPYVLELAVELPDAIEPRWPTLEEIRDAIGHAMTGAVFTIWGTHMVAGDDVSQPGAPIVLVQGGALPGTDAAKRLELTAPGSPIVGGAADGKLGVVS